MFHRAEHLAVFYVYKSEKKLAERKRVDDMKRYGLCLTVLILCAAALTLACGSALSEVFLQMQGSSLFLPL